MSYKEWVDEEELEAADLNGYIVRQTVPVFATTSDRSAAIGTPTDGRYSHVTGHGLEVAEGGLWKAPIHVFRPCITSARPATVGLQIGAAVFDTTLGKPIWWNGTNWVDATGATV